MGFISNDFLYMIKVDGTIVPRDGPASWPSGLNKRQWLVFYRINGMALIGAGVIDGHGQKWWDLPCKPHRVNILKHFQSNLLQTKKKKKKKSND